MHYPGRIVVVGETDAAIVGALQQALVKQGYADAALSMGFDLKLKGIVRLFQSQHSDSLRRPLLADGKVGPLTWAALFGAPASTAPLATGLGGAALSFAITQLGVREHPLHSNRGPEVDEYLRAAGAAPPAFWCMAFVHYCFLRVAGSPASNPFPRTAHCLTAWGQVKNANPAAIISRQSALTDPALVRPGMVFIHDYGGGHGHTGFVESVSGGAHITIEGNSDPTGGANGIEVLRVNRRKVTDAALKGFIAL